MRVKRRVRVITACALGVATLWAGTPASGAAPVTRIDGTVAVRCATTVLPTPSAWYFPAGTPRGLVWLQHGFARSDANVADLATHLAGAGFLVFTPSLPSVNLLGCTEQNLIGNSGFLNNVADLFAQSADPADPLRVDFAAAAARAGRPGLRLPDELVFVGHSAGGEAVEYVAQRLHAQYPATWARLRGLVLLDPVKSFVGSNTDDALRGLDASTLPIGAISSPPGLCNDFASGTAALHADLHRPFVGLTLRTGVHTDAEGASTDALGTLLCGTPKPANVAVLQTLTTAWVGDDVAGTRTTTYYPGGGYFDAVDR